MSAQLHFYDSAAPQNIPSGVYAAIYINGFRWPNSDVLRMERIFKISVDRNPLFARVARCIDIERGAAIPEDVIPFIWERLKAGHRDATAYVNRSNWQQVHELVLAERERTKNPNFLCRYWVATLDGTMHPTLPGVLPWAVQYTDSANRFDLSVLWGINDFVRP